MLSDCLLIIAIAFGTALAGRGITWLLVYRSDEYKRLKSEMDKKTKKLERKKKTIGGGAESVQDKSAKKKLEREEERLKATNRDMSMFKMKSMFAIGLAFTALLSTFNSIFEGRVVAKLPFHPIGFVQGLSHRNMISEKAAVEKERGEAAAGEDLNDQEVYKIDIPANRYDLLSVEGLSRAIRIFKQEIESPEYRFSDTKTRQKIIVKRETAQVRPYVFGVILSDVCFDEDSYASFINLQDKLHQNICGKRTLVAIGTHETGEKELYPLLSYREMTVTTPEINTKIGLRGDGDSTKQVVVPPTRHDVLHACDIAEDVGVAYGYNNLVTKLSESNTVAVAFPINKLCDNLRIKLSVFGWTEALNFALCSRDDISTKLRLPDALSEAVARTSLLPGLLKTLASNRDMPLPLKLFELQDVIPKDEKMDVGARNERRLAAVYYNKDAGFEIIQGFLDRMMRMLNGNPTKDQKGYHIEADDNPTFFPGRCARIIGPNGVFLGRIGALHPEVIAFFGLTHECVAVEFDVEPFLYIIVISLYDIFYGIVVFLFKYSFLFNSDLMRILYIVTFLYEFHGFNGLL
uniref:phenylalanine--tRNA ligase n=1 Tax=Caenorhabditis tropicalis TaxID=1561998 RepID=A0A1I7V0Y9_9PELO